MKEPDFFVETTVAVVRNWMDDNEDGAAFTHDLVNALDNAQAKVLGGEEKEQTILITITKGKADD